MSRAPGSLERLRAELADGQEFLAPALAPAADAELDGVFDPVLETVGRTEAERIEYALVLESVFEGYLLHHAAGRLIATEDPDLRLLAGDYMYAVGLDRLARLGDLDAVRELADLISLCARTHCGGAEPANRAWFAIRALWAAAAIAIAGGSWEGHGDVKEVARAGAASAEQILEVARERAAALGIEPELERALIALDEAAKAVSRTT